MGDIIDDIHSEHRMISRLLERLGRETDIFERGERPDFLLLKEIIEHFRAGAAECHHRREDMLYAALPEKEPQAQAGVEDLRREHEALGEHLRNMAQAIGSILLEETVSRPTFVAMTRNYISRQKHHMAVEERVILPLARERMEAAELKALGKAAEDALAGLPQFAELERFGRLLRQTEEERPA